MPEREEASTLSRLSKGVSRRSFLGTTGVAAASVAVSGTASAGGSCSRDTDKEEEKSNDTKSAQKPQEKAAIDVEGAQTEEPKQLPVTEPEIDNVVNVVEAGADNTGGESIRGVMDEIMASNTKFVFPEGTYRVDGKMRFTGVEDVILEGQNATIAPVSADEYETESRMFKFGVHYNPVKNIQVKGFTVDYTPSNTGARAFDVTVTDGMLIEDVTFEGVHDAGTWGPLHVDVTDSDGYGLLKNVKIPEGGIYTENTEQDAMPSVKWGPTAILLSPYHEGRVDIRGAEVGPFPDNGLYDSESPGRVVVAGGEYRNSGSASVRISGRDSGIYNSKVVVNQNRKLDEGQTAVRLDNGDTVVAGTEILMDKPNGRGIAVRPEVESVTIKDTSIVTNESDTNDIIQSVVFREGSGGGTIEGGSIEQNEDGPAIEIREGGDPVTVKGTEITGNSSGENGANEVVYCDRAGCKFLNMIIDMPAGSERSALGVFANDVIVKGGEYAASGKPINVNANDVSVSGVTAGSYGSRAGVDFAGSGDLMNSVVHGGVSGSVATSGNRYP